MSEGKKGKLGERELDIMQVLWKLGSGTVTEVHYALLKQEKLLAYTTVQTVMNRLEEKGHVRRDASERAHRFTPLLKEPTTIRAGLQRLADRFFGGSMEGVAAHLVERNLTAKQLERIESLINKHRRKA
jgi:predicted transcriptional regulator